MIPAMFAIVYLIAAAGTLISLISMLPLARVRPSWPSLVMLALAWPVVLCALLHGDHADEKTEGEL
jgi:uncharacterized membrane protein